MLSEKAKQLLEELDQETIAMGKIKLWPKKLKKTTS